jgi:predicted aldo/keto reductase-like oxidoreductase
MLVQRGIGPVAMKSLAGGAIHTKAGIPVKDAIRYTLSLPVSTVVSGIRTMKEMKENASIARAFKPMGEQEKASLLAKVEPVAGDGRYEGFKSTQNFDGGYHRRQHGFS